MNTAIYFVAAFLGGMVLGAFYFLNLWKTVKKVTDGQGKGSSLIVDFFIRISVVLAGFYIIMSGRWERMAIALLGFIIMREILKHILGRNKTTVQDC